MPGQPVFIDNISIKTENKPSTVIAPPKVEAIEVPELGYSIPSLSPEALSNLQFKYAILMDVPVEDMYDDKLLSFLESWYGTKYRMGGASRLGIDCSAFVQQFMMSMYGIMVPRTSGDQYHNSNRINKSQLQEGDLVFFHTQRRKNISHVGIYLRNNKFVHASSSSGVMISDLNETYFKTRFVSAGRYNIGSLGTN